MSRPRNILLTAVLAAVPLLVGSLVGPGRAAALPTPSGAISGKVTAVGGAPLERVTVNLYAASNPHQLMSNTLTAADGTYKFVALLAGNYDVCFDPSTSASGSSPDGYAFQCWYNQPTIATTNPVPVAVGHTTVGVGAALRANGGFSGVVTDSAGNPIPHANIQVDPSTSQINTTTKADGSYTISGLAPGLVVVCAAGPITNVGGGPYGWAPKCWRNDQTYNNPVLLTVQPGQITSEINFKLYKNGALAGSVLDGSAAPVANATVTVHSLAVGGLDSTFTTTSNGLFEFDDLAPDFYTVCATSGSKSACWKATVPGSATPIVVPQTVKVKGIAITLT